MKYITLIFCIFGGFLVHCVLGDIRCYTCVSQGGGDDTCIKSPAAAPNPVTLCPYKYCTIRRIEYASEPGVIQSFLRGCEDYPLPNGENPSEDIIVWAQSCNYEDLCNVGNGLSSLKPGSNNGNGGGASGPVIVLPPSQNAGTLISYSKVLLATLAAFATVFVLKC